MTIKTVKTNDFVSAMPHLLKVTLTPQKLPEHDTLGNISDSNHDGYSGTDSSFSLHSRSVEYEVFTQSHGHPRHLTGVSVKGRSPAHGHRTSTMHGLELCPLVFVLFCFFTTHTCQFLFPFCCCFCFSMGLISKQLRLAWTSRWIPLWPQTQNPSGSGI